MIVNSKISLNTEVKDSSKILSAHSLTTNVDSQHTLSGFYNINLGKKFFKNNLLTKLFFNLENRDSKYYLEKKWLYLVMKPMLLGENEDDPRNQNYFNTFYEKVNQPYSLYPFGDFVDKLSSIFYNS